MSLGVFGCMISKGGRSQDSLLHCCFDDAEVILVAITSCIKNQSEGDLKVNVQLYPDVSQSSVKMSLLYKDDLNRAECIKEAEP